MACEEAPNDSVSPRHFVGIDLGREPVLDSTTITKLRKLLRDYKLGEALFTKVGKELQVRGFKVNTDTIVGEPSSAMNSNKRRGTDMHQTGKGQ